MEHSKKFQNKHPFIIFVFILLFSTLGFAENLERQKMGTTDDLEEAHITFIFSGNQAQSIITKLTKAEVRTYTVYGGILKVYIGENIICLDRIPSTDDKSTSCRMVVDDYGQAVDIRKTMKDFIDSLSNLFFQDDRRVP